MKNQQNWATNLACSYYEEFKKETKINYWLLSPLLPLVAGYFLAPLIVAQMNVPIKPVTWNVQFVIILCATMNLVAMFIEISCVKIKTTAAQYLIIRFLDDIQLMNVPPTLAHREGRDLFIALLADDFVSPLPVKENEKFMAWRNSLQV
jgi:hypothetical protein